MNKYQFSFQGKRSANLCTLAIMAIAVLLPTLAFANQASVEPFFKHFTITKNSKGEADLILIKNDARKFSIEPLFEEVAQDLTFAQTLSITDDSDSYFYAWDSNEMPAWSEAQKRLARQALEKAQGIDLDAALKDPKFKETMAKIEERFKKHFVGYKVMANLNDPRFFYSRAVVSQTMNWALNFVQKRLKDDSNLALARYIVGRLGELIEGRRIFHQNMLLHYLEVFPAEKLGLTDKEAKRALSSIYEHQIPFFAYWISNQAKTHWDHFGALRFAAYYDLASQTLLQNKKQYDTIDERIDMAFAKITEKGHRKVINLIDKEYMFSSRPSVAFYYEAPNKVRLQRTILQLIQLGLGYVPATHWALAIAKSGLTSFIDSMYVAQTKTEGALLGYFESIGANDSAEAVKAQTINPYVIQDLNL